MTVTINDEKLIKSLLNYLNQGSDSVNGLFKNIVNYSDIEHYPRHFKIEKGLVATTGSERGSLPHNLVVDLKYTTSAQKEIYTKILSQGDFTFDSYDIFEASKTNKEDPIVTLTFTEDSMSFIRSSGESIDFEPDPIMESHKEAKEKLLDSIIIKYSASEYDIKVPEELVAKIISLSSADSFRLVFDVVDGSVSVDDDREEFIRRSDTQLQATFISPMIKGLKRMSKKTKLKENTPEYFAEAEKQGIDISENPKVDLTTYTYTDMMIKLYVGKDEELQGNLYGFEIILDNKKSLSKQLFIITDY